MDRGTAKSAAKMLRIVRPHCHEEITAALPWDRSRAQVSWMTADDLPGRNAGKTGLSVGPGFLDDQVFIAVGSGSIYCFDFAPKVFGFEIKRQVACWPRHEIRATAQRTNMVTYLFITTRLGEKHSFETTTMSVSKAQLVEAFLAALGVAQIDRLYLGY